MVVGPLKKLIASALGTPVRIAITELTHRTAELQHICRKRIPTRVLEQYALASSKRFTKSLTRLMYSERARHKAAAVERNKKITSAPGNK